MPDGPTTDEDDSHPFTATWWIEPGRVLGGCYPGDPDPEQAERKLAALAAAGVSVVVNLQEPTERGRSGMPFPDYAAYLTKEVAARGRCLELHNFPWPDQNVPTPDLMARLLSVLGRATDNGRLVYVHCWGGHGRTGTVAACWLVSRGATAEAFAAIGQRRSHEERLVRWPAPITEFQREFVRSWESFGWG